MIKVLTQNAYNRQEIRALIETEFKAIDFFTKLPEKGKVLLKPNFVVPSAPEDPSCTHPEFYMAIADLLIAQGFQVGIGDSPAFGSCAKALKMHGIYDEVKDKGIHIVEFRGQDAYDGVKDSRSYKRLTLASELREWDRVINLPKQKVHQQFMFTGACKNLYGCVAGKKKVILHNLCKNDPVKFAQMILANARKVRAVFHISDGIEAMHIKGPRGGKPYALGKIIMSDNPLIHDFIQAKMFRFDPADTPLFKALPEEMYQSISQACNETLSSPEFSIADELIHSYATDISFSPPKLLRSAIRSFKFKLSGKLN